MTMHVKGEGLKFPDGTEQTTAGVGGSGDGTGGSGVYTKDETDTLLNTKADVGVSYTKAEVDVKIDTKADIGVSYTKAETEARLVTKADVADTYTKGQTDTLLDTKANVTDVDASQAAQDTLIAANTAKVSNVTHTGDVTGSTTLTIGANKVNASKINVSGNGANNQMLCSSGNGAMKWLNQPAGGASTTYNAVKTYSFSPGANSWSDNQTHAFNGKSGTWRIMGRGPAYNATQAYFLIIRLS